MNVPSRKETIARMREQGKTIAAVLPIHYPRALLLAHNIHPIELWGPPGIPSTAAEKHLQPYICSIVRNALAFLLNGGLDATDLILIPHTCDSLQGLTSILRDFIRPRQPVLPLYLPRGRRESDVEFLAAELRRLSEQLTALTGVAVNEERLNSCLNRQEKWDAGFARIRNERDRFSIDDLSFYSLVRRREYLPDEWLLPELEALPRVDSPNRESVRLLLSGIVPEPMSLFSELNRLGARVVADDLAGLSRRNYAPVPDSLPWQRLARRLLSAPPCSTRGAAIAARVKYLKERCQATGAQGVLFYLPKFCEPELFYLPQMRKELQAAGIPSLVLEVDLTDGWNQQLQNRLAAFIEMLR